MYPSDQRLSMPRRGLLALAGAFSLSALAGCGSDRSSAGSTSTETASAGSFPVVIRHALGSTTIKQEPQRIVTIGQGATEALISMGVYPVGVETYAWGADKDGYLPWNREAFEKAGRPLPALFAGGEQLDVEAIAELEPDLILAPWSGLTQKQYDQLTAFCPTVAYEKSAWTTTWDGEIRMVAKALGRPSDGDKVISDLKKTLADTAAQHPRWKGITFSYIYTQGQGTLGIFRPTEQRVALISMLGLTVDPIVDTITANDGSDWALISLENADKLKDSDLIFTFHLDAATKKQATSQRLYSSIPAIKRDSVVAPTDPQLVTAISMINPLTVPWSLPRLTDLIDQAVAKVTD